MLFISWNKMQPWREGVEGAVGGAGAEGARQKGKPFPAFSRHPQRVRS